MSTSELCYLSAGDMLRRFKARELSPVEVMEAMIARAEVVESSVNALAFEYFDVALEGARKAETRYMRRHARQRALEGLPLAVKEDTALKGKPQTLGSLIYKDRIADHTSPSVQRLLNAGAIIHAQTTCPEFVWPWTCTSRLHGVTRNPWNLKVTSGASSGGAAAALAAGTTVLATGTDSAGSIRMPASQCGVVGYKPPYGRNPQSADLSMDMFMHLGPMTRTVADAALMQNIMSGYHQDDHATVRERVRLSVEDGDVRGVKVAYSLDMAAHPLATDVRQRTSEALERLKSLGAVVEEVHLPWAAELFAKASRWGDLVYADEFIEAVESHPDLVCDYTQVFAERSRNTTPKMMHDLMKTIGRAWLAFSPVLKRHDAFLCPTVSSTAIPCEGPDTEPCVDVGGTHCYPHDVVMTFYFDAFGRCPVITVPTGFADNGVPCGLQVVARTYDDARVFRVAKALEASYPLYLDPTTCPTIP